AAGAGAAGSGALLAVAGLAGLASIVGSIALSDDDDKGGNHSPSFDDGKDGGEVFERADGAADENKTTHEASADIAFHDKDKDDVHKVTAKLVSVNDPVDEKLQSHGTFTAKIAGDKVEWDYKVEDSAIDYLGEGEKRTEIFEITVDDGHGGTTTKRVPITITGRNDAPEAKDISAEADENETIVLKPDYSDPDRNDTHTFKLDTSGTKGKVTLNEDGTFSYDPNGAFDYLGENEVAYDTFKYTVRDNHGAEVTKTAKVKITGQNDAPVAKDVFAETTENAATTIKPNVSDADKDDTHTFKLDTTGTKGEVTLNEDGTFAYDPGDAFDHLSENEVAYDTFKYTVRDEHGAEVTKTAKVKITGQNDAPVAKDVSAETTENAATTIKPEFSDVDRNDTHTFKLDTTGTKGEVIVNKDGTFAYDPGDAFDWLGENEIAYDTFKYTVRDNHGAEVTKEVKVKITGQNDAPVAKDITAEAKEDGPGITIKPDVTDADKGDTHTFKLDTTGTKGEVTVNKDGTFSYDPNGAFEHLGENEVAYDTFKYTVRDNHGAEVTKEVKVKITGQNDAPMAKDVSAETTENAATDIKPDFSDVDKNDTHTVKLDTTGTKGEVTLNEDDGTFAYDPGDAFDHLSEDEVAYDTFKYTVRDNHGAEVTKEVKVKITGQNDAPEVEDVSLTAEAIKNPGFDGKPDFTGWHIDNNSSGLDGADKVSSVSLIEHKDGEDSGQKFLSDDQDHLAYFQIKGGVDKGATAWGPKITSDPFYANSGDHIESIVGWGSLYDTSKGWDQYHLKVTLTNVDTGEIYTWDRLEGESDFSIPEAGRYTVSYRLGLTDTNRDGRVHATEFIDSASLKSDLVGTDHEYAFDKGQFLAKATDPEGDKLDVISVADKSALGARVWIGADGKIHYDASGVDNLDPGETRTDTFKYTVSDGHGGETEATASIKLYGRNDAPDVKDVTAEVKEDGPAIDITSDFTDANKNDTHTFKVDTTGTKGKVVDNGDGTFSYDPNGAFEHLGENEVAYDTFKYTVRDNHGAESTKEVKVKITGENDAPELENVALKVDAIYNGGFENGSAGWKLDESRSNDFIQNQKPITYPDLLAAEVTHGPLSPWNLFPDDPDVARLTIAGWVRGNGTGWGPSATSDSFVGRAQDKIEIQYALWADYPDAPGKDVALGRIILVNKHTGQEYEVLDSSQQGGSWSGVQTLEFKLPETGEYELQFRVGGRDDTGGGYARGDLYIGKANVETDLVGTEREYTFGKDQFLAGASDADGDKLDVTSVSDKSALGAKVWIGTDGEIHYDATDLDNLYAGKIYSDTITYTVSDGHGGETEATASIKVYGDGKIAEDKPEPEPRAANDNPLDDLSSLFDDNGGRHHGPAEDNGARQADNGNHHPALFDDNNTAHLMIA
ncbi:Ig-like domain-containing protein, partial [Nitratireductor sp. GCM10026969]|uniref:Ig-like domain-containing protein n=1 Tax=Nitratireductor sp. GCM10026969 TaxID=3252645 RepID=UPI003616A512